MKFQANEIESLYKRVRGYVLTQDQLYKDLVRMERAFAKKEQSLNETLAKRNRELEEYKKRESLEKNALVGGNVDSKVIELTKKNSILEVSYMQLSRKYQALEE